MATPENFLIFIALLAAFWLMTFAAGSIGFYAVEMLYFRSALSSRSAAFLLKESAAAGSPS